MKLISLILLAGLSSAELVDRARTASAGGDHATAAGCYDQLEQQGYASGLLYLNQGNAHFLAGQVPQAILAYRRAERLIPNDPHLRASLEEARRQVLDAPPAASSWLPANLPWPARSHQILLALSLWTLGWGLAVCAQFRPGRACWILAFLALLSSLTLAGATYLDERRDQLQPLAVVAVDGVILRQGNGNSYPAIEKHGVPVKLNRGVELRILQVRKNGWQRVVLTDGRTGWVPQDLVLSDRALPAP